MQSVGMWDIKTIVKYVNSANPGTAVHLLSHDRQYIVNSEDSLRETKVIFDCLERENIYTSVALSFPSTFLTVMKNNGFFQWPD